MEKSINDFIIEVPKSHRDEIKLGSGINLKVDVRFNQGSYVNLIGKVINIPERFKTKVNVGDYVLVDRNMITFQTHSDDLVVKSKFLVDEKKGHYRISPDMVYLYKENLEDEWICPAPYLFVEPIPIEEQNTTSGIGFTQKGYKGNLECYGRIFYLNESLTDYLKVGDVIFYKKDREYEFIIDDKILYHMDNADILAKVENYEQSQLL